MSQSSFKRATSRRSANRKALEQKILTAAEGVFAEHGFDGSSLEAIAESAGLSRQNMLYYFPSKESLYQNVLKHILDLWIEKMALMGQAGDTPATMLENYIRGKLEISRIHPDGSKVFANEVIRGGSYLKDYLEKDLLPQLEADLELVRGWIASGKMDPVDPEHLFFTIWASTQTYADFSSQISLALGKSELDEEDFTKAGDFLTHVLLKGLGLR
ncbi:TetR family transcriptional regulator C-terminal domain-containing protein [Halomonas icarae]|uniref:TetR family transcriptional regulator n=1 Tax=Halomonas icarae TaxID=2691040 RepID=A0A7X4VZZ9_9GAMM|nr:TetR family transcriptional regulator C-terminal domain-containing protein [Halomonas icarae]MDR5903535.1 TetR family transcriptional regulator C-terminal domain-containing protein [Halomonas icarae]NAW13371.1 TetR family transcriptional regulator [Halomonas icarae]